MPTQEQKDSHRLHRFVCAPKDAPVGAALAFNLCNLCNLWGIFALIPHNPWTD